MSDYASGTWPPEIVLGVQNVPPPTALYVQKTDQLRLSVWNTLASQALFLDLRLLMPDGQIVANQFRLVATSDRVVSELTVALPECFLLSAVIWPDNLTTRSGHTYTRLVLLRGVGTALSRGQLLLSNYVTSTAFLGWPGAQHRGSQEGFGLIRGITGANPAAGAEVTESVPTNAVWHIMGIRLNLVTSVDAGSRIVVLVIDDGTTNIHAIEANAAQTASQNREYTFAVGLDLKSPTGSIFHAPLPAELRISEGYRFRTVTTGLFAADDWASPVYLVEEWLEE